MHEMTPSTALLPRMKPEVARRRIKAFRGRFSDAYLYLAFHAAFPLVLTPDLLYRLRTNFQRDVHNEELNIPWIAVADLLLSRLCNEVGYELYEMDVAIRTELLSQLKSHPRFGPLRIYDLSNFLRIYVKHQLGSSLPGVRKFAQAQDWMALAATRPDEVARSIALTLSKLSSDDRAEFARMAALIEAFIELSADLTRLLTYSKSMEFYASGDEESAKTELSKATVQGQAIEVQGVSLSVPDQVRGEAKRKQERERHRPLEATVPLPPLSATSLPAILIGGPPNAGKSILTYKLKQELLRREISHYWLHANPDMEGDWFFEGDLETVRQTRLKVWDYRHWTDIFREIVCRDLAHRYLPLLVDPGSLPTDADNCIFQGCTHSILLLKDEDEKATQTWRRYTTTNGLLPLAELRSQLEGASILTAKEPIITGTITGLVRGASIHNTVFDALLERVSQLFSSISPDELEKYHLNYAPIEFVIHLPHQLHALAPDTDRWTTDMLQPLLANLPAQSAMAVYGRAPNWVYGALATHTAPQPFHQFDARLGWVTPPALQARTSGQLSQPLIYIKEENYNDSYVILIHPIHNYLDYRETDQLLLPEPPPHRGVVVSGKLPLWLFTALSLFYAQRNVPWIALNDARDNRPVVIYSQVPSHPIGKILPKLV